MYTTLNTFVITFKVFYEAVHPCSYLQTKFIQKRKCSRVISVSPWPFNFSRKSISCLKIGFNLKSAATYLKTGALLNWPQIPWIVAIFRYDLIDISSSKYHGRKSHRDHYLFLRLSRSIRQVGVTKHLLYQTNLHKK